MGSWRLLCNPTRCQAVSAPVHSPVRSSSLEPEGRLEKRKGALRSTGDPLYMSLQSPAWMDLRPSWESACCTAPDIGAMGPSLICVDFPAGCDCFDVDDNAVCSENTSVHCHRSATAIAQHSRDHLPSACTHNVVIAHQRGTTLIEILRICWLGILDAWPAIPFADPGVHRRGTTTGGATMHDIESGAGDVETVASLLIVTHPGA